MGSLQFGYHMGELNAAAQYIACEYLSKEVQKIDDVQCIVMSAEQLALVISIFSVGGLIGSFLCSSLADKKGRKATCLINSATFVIGSLILYFAHSLSWFIIGRVVLGVASGASIVLTSLMIHEIAPTHLRDSLGTFNQAFINIGILLVQTLSLWWATPFAWRYLFVFSSIFAIIQLVLGSYLLEETPRWLLDNGFEKKAKSVSLKFNLISKNSSLNGIEDGFIFENQTTFQHSDLQQNQRKTVIGWKEYLSKKKYKTSVIFVTIILVGQQLCGINSIILYSSKVIINLSGENGAALAKRVNFLISIVNVIFTFVSPKTINLIGTNLSLTFSAIFMGLFSFLIAISLAFNYLYMLIAFLILFIIAFALGVGPIPFLIISDLTPLEARSISQSFGTVNNWLGTFFVSFTFPILSDALGMPIVFGMFSFCSIAFAAIIFYKLPERSFEENGDEHQRLI